MSGFDLNPSSESETRTKDRTRDEAQSWLARFAPLVMSDEPSTDAALRKQVGLVERLAEEAEALLPRLESLDTLDDIELRQTFRRAATQLQSLEGDLRKRLARVSPGDPEGRVDLNALQERLNERAARQEMGLPTNEEIPAVLRMRTSPGNIAAGVGLGIFGIGWNSFTLFHSVLMIGGMAKAFGWMALFLLAFYAIFFAVGFGMLWGAYVAASAEDIELDGFELTVERKLGFLRSRKRYTLGPKSRAKVGKAQQTVSSSRSQTSRAVIIADNQGKPISIGSSAMEDLRKSTADRINAYLAAQA